MAEGVQFRANAQGRRSTMEGGKSAWAAAAEASDPVLAAKIRAEKDWRSRYASHVVRVAAVSARSEADAVRVAEAGLTALHGALEFVRDGASKSIADAMASPAADRAFRTGRVHGTGEVATAIEVPYGAKALRGEALSAQAGAWVDYGAMEPAAAAALAQAVAHPEWLDMRGRVFVVLGATSALGPLDDLLRCGATVVAVARPSAEKWRTLLATARASAGTLIFPLGPALGDKAAEDANDATLCAAAGADLLTQTPELGAWLAGVASAEGAPLTLANYVYLDSDAHVRATVAADALIDVVAAAVPAGASFSLAYLQTPSVAHIVGDCVRAAAATRYEACWYRALGCASNAPTPAGASGERRGARYVHDGLIPLQGPNYALAKTAQLWRAVLARCRDRTLVSANVAPPARTASMIAGSNRNAKALGTALSGMGHFKPLLAFEEQTVARVMALLLIHDLRNPSAPANPETALDHPHDLFADSAFHGGSFRLGASRPPPIRPTHRRALSAAPLAARLPAAHRPCPRAYGRRQAELDGHALVPLGPRLAHRPAPRPKVTTPPGRRTRQPRTYRGRVLRMIRRRISKRYTGNTDASSRTERNPH